MKFIFQEGQMMAAAASEEPVNTFDLLIEPVRDKGNEWAAEVMQWILSNMGELFKEFGLWLLQVAPDTLLTLGMIFCLGAICSIPRTGKWAAASVTAALLTEVVRKGMGL